jgi:hypothetical protein
MGIGGGAGADSLRPRRALFAALCLQLVAAADDGRNWTDQADPIVVGP